MNRIRRSWPMYGAATLGVVAVAAYAATAASGRQAANTMSARSPVHAGVASVANPAPSVAATAQTRRPLSFYSGGVNTDMFNPPVPPAPKPVVVTPIVPTVPVMPVNPLADWSYTGTIHQGDRTTALIENSKTHEGQFIQVGDHVLGGSATAISDQMVTITIDGNPVQLAKSDQITVTPLSADANIQVPAPAQPAPGTPGAPGTFNLGAVQFQFGQMTPEQRAARRAARRQQFLNRNFNN